TRRPLAEPLEGQELADRAPALDGRALGARAELAELGRPVGRVEVAAGARVDLAFVEPRPERFDRAGAARVRPHVDGRHGAVPRVEAEEPMPEGREADGADLARARE